MYRSIPIAALALSLAACTHLGTNVAGDFSCRSPKTGCQPLSEADSQALGELVKSKGKAPAELRQRTTVPAAHASRTDERTLKVVFPAHVDSSGTLHEEAVAWTVVEAARWTGELHPKKIAEPNGTLRALRNVLKEQARSAAEAAPHRESFPSVGSGPGDPANPFLPTSPLAIPSPGGEAQTDVTTPAADASVTEGSDMSPTRPVRAPRPLEKSLRVWPSAEAIEKAKTRSGTSGTAPLTESK